MGLKLQNRLAVNLTLQIIFVVLIISAGFYVLTATQTKELKKIIFDKAELYTFILGSNLDKIMDDNKNAYDNLQGATVETAKAYASVEELNVITKSKVILASSVAAKNFKSADARFQSIIDEVVSLKQSKSITQKALGLENVIHFMPIMVTKGEAKELVGILQSTIQFPSEQVGIRSAMRTGEKTYFRSEAFGISEKLGNDLMQFLNEAERNIGYLQRIIGNMTNDADINAIRIYFQELGILISDQGGEPLVFISQNRSPLQAQAMSKKTTITGDQPSSSQELLVASPLLLSRDGGTYIGGAVEIAFSLTEIQSVILKQRKNIFLMNLVITVVFCLLIGFFFKRRIFSPLKELGTLTQRIKEDNFTERSRIFAQDEIGQLAEGFNSMMDDLAQSKKEIKEWNIKLQERVDQVSRELKEKQDQLLKSEKMASLGMLSSGIAHEINNPLGIILGESQMLIKELKKKGKKLDPKEAEELLVHIEEQTKRCSHIVKSLLQFTRKKGFQFIDTHIKESLDNALEFTHSQLANKKITVEKDYDDSLPLIQADSIQLEQVFINILRNALQSVTKKGRINISTELKDGFLCIAFEDSGEGIHKKDLNKIFDPFFSTKEIGEGAGLGLSVSYGIVKAHGGDIEVKSKKGEGTTMTVKLPIKKAA